MLQWYRDDSKKLSKALRREEAVLEHEKGFER